MAKIEITREELLALIEHHTKLLNTMSTNARFQGLSVSKLTERAKRIAELTDAVVPADCTEA